MAGQPGQRVRAGLLVVGPRAFDGDLVAGGLEGHLRIGGQERVPGDVLAADHAFQQEGVRASCEMAANAVTGVRLSASNWQ